MCLCVSLQVFQQALHRQPNTAAQYLQQMYAAQQQHLMLQTAALQQQHSLSTAQLQSLAAVQQVSKQSLNERTSPTKNKWCYCCCQRWKWHVLKLVIVEFMDWSAFLSCSLLPWNRPVLQLAGKALHKMALHHSKQDPLRPRWVQSEC